MRANKRNAPSRPAGASIESLATSSRLWLRQRQASDLARPRVGNPGAPKGAIKLSVCRRSDNVQIRDPHTHLLPIYVLRRTLYRTVNQKSATQLKGLYRFQLQETRKFALVYGNLSKKQLYNLYNQALFSQGVEAFLDLLEKRLDVVVFRAGFCFSIFQSRHFINHKFICVNGNLLTISSYPCRPGDLISCKPFPAARARRLGESFVKKNLENFYRRMISNSFADRRRPRRGGGTLHSDQKPMTPLDRGSTSFTKREIYSSTKVRSVLTS